MFSEDKSKKLSEKEKEIFHRIVAKGLFLSKRARPDILPIVSVLCTQVKSPGKRDWARLIRLLKYMKNTEEDVLVLNARNGIGSVEWYIDASFAVHPDFKSHSGAIMKFSGGKGAVQSMSCKQKLNTSSSTTAELVAVDNILPLVLWTPLFMECQGYLVNENLCFRIIKVQFYWRKMEREVLENIPEH
jgi:hypothetical protein